MDFEALFCFSLATTSSIQDGAITNSPNTLNA